MTRFPHLHFHSPFSFLDGAARLEAALPAAAERGIGALALTDHNNVSGAVLFHRLALAAGVKPIQGAEVTLEGGGHLTLLARGPTGYGALCRLITRAHLGAERRRPALAWTDLETEIGSATAGDHDLFALSGCRRGDIASLLWAGRAEEAYQAAGRYVDLFGRDYFILEVQRDFLPGGPRVETGLIDLGGRLGLRLAATNNVHFLDKNDFWIHDLLTCARTLTTVADIHPERRLNAENYLKPARAMAALFSDFPEALKGALEIAEACRPSLQPGRRLHPAFPLPSGETSAALFLRKMTLAGASRRYGKVTRSISRRLEHELNIICHLGYEDYFLLLWDLCLFARREGIRFAGRGSAADSAVVFCLGITNVDAIARGLLFERFMSLERGEKPDIDIDFDTRYREKVAEYVTGKYGRDRVASVCTYNTFLARSAVRDLGQALGFPLADLDRLAKRLPYGQHAGAIPKTIVTLPELRDSGLPFWKFERLFAAAEKVAGLPRHLGTHLGGIVVCRDSLLSVTPLQEAAKGAIVCQFDKEYVEDLGLIKLDLLSLRTLSAVASAAEDLEKRGECDYDAIPGRDAATMTMIRSGETIGVFQLESPAQRALQVRLGATNFEDIVAGVALIRPGPIKGNMVEPFVARRQGREPVTYLHPRLEPILRKTYGVVLFQEQVIEIATVVAGFNPGEADDLRRVMTHARHGPVMEELGRLFVAKAVARGVSEEVAERIFACLEGYASYGFCEAHAAAFADTAYRTAYLVRHHPAEFFAAILSHEPMGYYPPGTLCVEASRRGVGIRGPDVNRSGERYLVEEAAGGKAIRVSLRQVKGMQGRVVEAVLKARKEGGAFKSLDDYCRRAGPETPLNVLEALILVGAFDSLDPNRRRLLWTLPSVLTAAGRGPGLLDDAEAGPRAGDGLSDSGRVNGIGDFSLEERMRLEYDLLGFSPEHHIMGYLRPRLTAAGFVSSSELKQLAPGQVVRIGGLAIRPHRPPVRSGKTIVFLSLEDELGLTDITVFEKTYQVYGKILFADPCPPLAVLGRVERRDRATTVVARRVENLNTALQLPSFSS
jgi:error-prone DNA polymerase